MVKMRSSSNNLDDTNNPFRRRCVVFIRRCNPKQPAPPERGRHHHSSLTSLSYFIPHPFIASVVSRHSSPRALLHAHLPSAQRISRHPESPGCAGITSRSRSCNTSRTGTPAQAPNQPCIQLQLSSRESHTRRTEENDFRVFLTQRTRWGMDGRNFCGRTDRTSSIIGAFSWIVDAMILPPSLSRSLAVCAGRGAAADRQRRPESLRVAVAPSNWPKPYARGYPKR